MLLAVIMAAYIVVSSSSVLIKRCGWNKNHKRNYQRDFKMVRLGFIRAHHFLIKANVVSFFGWVLSGK